MINWHTYLKSLCNTYAKWWQIYTITDVVGRQRVEVETPPLLLNFMVQTVPGIEERRKEEKIERLGVLEGLRKYASDHVLLVGRPGSGKSTALARLLVEEAERGRKASGRSPLNPPLTRREEIPLDHPLEQPENSSLAPPLTRGAGGDLPKIPVLVELRYYRTSILNLIQDFLQRHDPNLTVDAKTLKTWLRQGQLLLLVDGVNELPSEEARRDLHKFRQDYQKTTPMIFTTRDLGVGGDLGIAEKLEMQPLSEAQMQQFVHAYLPGQGEQMLRQLGSRLRELGQTPLLLWMLCCLFKDRGNVPPNLALVFRQFAQSYYDKLKQDVPISDESRRWCQLILQHLAWRMTQGREAAELQVAISRQEAEEILTAYLRNEGFAQPRNLAMEWLTDLLKHHLLQLGTNNQIEFRHQLIQEHCTAEILLKLLPSLGDDQLKREYLNYLKWTEPLALMLELVEDEAQAVRVVKLALEVDLRLGARLAGKVKPEWQEQTLGLVVGLGIPQLLKTELLKLAKPERVIPALTIPIRLEDKGFVEPRRVKDTSDITTNAAISRSAKVSGDKDSAVRRKVVVEVLDEINSDTAVTSVAKALEDENSVVRARAVYALGKIGSDLVIPLLVKALGDKNYIVRWIAAEALGKISSDIAITSLAKVLEDENHVVRTTAAYALGTIGSDTAILLLSKLILCKENNICKSVTYALVKVSSNIAIPLLDQVLEDEDFILRRIAVEVLGEIRSVEAIPLLSKALKDERSVVRRMAGYALGKIDSDAVISLLTQALKDEDFVLRRIVVEALGKIGSDAVTYPLIEALEDKNFDVCESAIDALSKIGSAAAITTLAKALKDEAFWIIKGNYIINKTTEALKEIQNRCKFYNYTLTQPNIPPVPQKSAPKSITQPQQQPMQEDSSKSAPKRDQVFISYSHKDTKWLDKLQTMLKPMMRNNTISVWDDTAIKPGSKWRDEIEKALASANVAVLMVSQNFLASDFITKHELPPLLNAAEQEGLKIIWVPVSYCMYEETEIHEYQAAHTPSQPLQSLKGAKLDQVLVNICQEIKAASAAT